MNKRHIHTLNPGKRTKKGFPFAISFYFPFREGIQNILYCLFTISNQESVNKLRHRQWINSARSTSDNKGIVARRIVSFFRPQRYSAKMKHIKESCIRK